MGRVMGLDKPKKLSCEEVRRLNKLLCKKLSAMRSELHAAREVIKAAKNLIWQLKAMQQEQYEKLVLNQTLESASKNWDTLSKTIDFEILDKALSAYEYRFGPIEDGVEKQKKKK